MKNASNKFIPVPADEMARLTDSTLELIKYSKELEGKVEQLTAELDREKSAKREKVILEKVASEPPVNPAEILLDVLESKSLITGSTKTKIASLSEKDPRRAVEHMVDIIVSTALETSSMGSLVDGHEKPASHRVTRPADPHGDFAFLSRK